MLDWIKQKQRQIQFRQAGKTLLKQANLQYFVLFLGNPRSGTTLTRSLLDNHPKVLLGNEVNVLRYVQAGEKWETILGRIQQNAMAFRQQAVWEGYSYLSNSNVPIDENISIIGDKKAGVSTKLLDAHPQLLEQLNVYLPIPIKFIHCVRHPYDVIATKTRKNQQSIDFNIERYFEIEKSVQKFMSKIGKEHYHLLYHENWFEDVSSNLMQLLEFLGLAESAYIDTKIIAKKANLSRQQIVWTQVHLEKIMKNIQAVPHLHPYFENK